MSGMVGDIGAFSLAKLGCSLTVVNLLMTTQYVSGYRLAEDTSVHHLSRQKKNIKKVLSEENFGTCPCCG